MPNRYLPLALLCIAGVLGTEPKRDRYGDPLPEGAIARLGGLRLRADSPIRTGAFSPDGKLLATGGAGFGKMGAIVLWDAATGKVARCLPSALHSSLHGLRFSADGKSLILAWSDGCIRIVDAATGAEQKKFETPKRNALLAVDVSREGKTAATTDSRGNIAIWDISRGKILREYTIPRHLISYHGRSPFNPVTALTPDGKHLVLPHADCSLHLLETASGKEIAAFEMPPRGPGAPTLPAVAVSPDGRYLAYGNRDIPATLCDLKTGKRLHTLTSSKTSVFGLLFLPDSRALVVQNHGEIRLFDVSSGKEIRKLSKSAGIGYPLAISPDGKTIAVLETEHALALWDVKSGRKKYSSVRHVSLVQMIVFFPDGKRLVSSDQSGNRIVWDIASSQVLAHDANVNIYDKPRSLTVAADGKTVRFLSDDQFIHRWNPDENGKSSREQIKDNPNDFILSPGGQTLAVTYHPSRSQVWLRDLQGGKSARAIALPGNAPIRNLSFSPDGRLLQIGVSENACSLWNVNTGKFVREIKEVESRQNPNYWYFAKDSRSMAYFDNSSSNLHVCIRETASGGQRLKAPVPRAASGWLVFSPDGRFLACAYSGGVLVLGTATGKELARWPGPQGTIFSLAFSRDSRLLASGGGDGTILLWKVPDGEGLPATLKAEEAAALWQTLGDSDAARANRARAGLAAAPAQAVPLLKQRFPTVWKKPDAERLTSLIAELDDDAFKIRERATQELAEAGSDAADALHHALAKTPSAEAKKRMEDLLNRLNKGGSPKRLRALRAIEVLERIGTPQARKLLRELAAKPLPAELREDIEASLRRLNGRLPAISRREPMP